MKVPFVIIEAHPDYKRPFASHEFGSINEDEIENFFLQAICDFILDRKDKTAFKTAEDVSKFWLDFYNDSYMDMCPWSAYVFIDSEWRNVTPDDKLVFEYIEN
jgi:hypothetical protein